MIDAPLKGILHVWGELLLARHGVNGFGGNVAEIYAYPLEARDPEHDEAIRRWKQKGGLGDNDGRPINPQPARSLAELLRIFEADHEECELTVDGEVFDPQAGVPLTDHRWHIAVDAPWTDAEKAKRNTAGDMAYLLLKFGAHKTDCLVNSFHERGVDPTPGCSCGWTDLSTVVEKMQ